MALCKPKCPGGRVSEAALKSDHDEENMYELFRLQKYDGAETTEIIDQASLDGDIPYYFCEDISSKEDEVEELLVCTYDFISDYFSSYPPLTICFTILGSSE